MKRHPLVTIVTPSLNQAMYLKDCLGTVQHQTYPYIEHIVIDGGSTDGSIEMLEEWAIAAPSRRLVVGKDRGMYDALNAGFNIARGDLFAYLNTDDLYMPHAISSLVGTQQNTNADVVYGDMVRFYTDDNRVVIKFLPKFDKGFYGFYYSFGQPSTLWQRPLWRKLGGFDSALQSSGDTAFFMRAAHMGAKFERVDEIISIDRHRPESISSKRKKTGLEELAVAKAQFGVWRGPLERYLWGYIRVILGLGQQLLLATLFGIEMRRRNPKRWPEFVSGNYISTFSALRNMLNVIPEPLLKKKKAIGTLEWKRIIRFS